MPLTLVFKLVQMHVCIFIYQSESNGSICTVCSQLRLMEIRVSVCITKYLHALNSTPLYSANLEIYSWIYGHMLL